MGMWAALSTQVFLQFPSMLVLWSWCLPWLSPCQSPENKSHPVSLLGFYAAAHHCSTFHIRTIGITKSIIVEIFLFNPVRIVEVFLFNPIRSITTVSWNTAALHSMQEKEEIEHLLVISWCTPQCEVRAPSSHSNACSGPHCPLARAKAIWGWAVLTQDIIEWPFEEVKSSISSHFQWCFWHITTKGLILLTMHLLWLFAPAQTEEEALGHPHIRVIPAPQDKIPPFSSQAINPSTW